MLRDALLENIHRAQLNPLEEAAAYQQLLEEFGVTHEELADRLGRSRPVSLQHDPAAEAARSPVQRRVAAGVLSAGHARALLGLDDPGQQEELATPDRRRGPVGPRDRGGGARCAPARGAGRRRARTPASRTRLRGLTSWPSALSDTFDTRVRVELGQRKGRIVVEFAVGGGPGADRRSSWAGALG